MDQFSYQYKFHHLCNNLTRVDSHYSNYTSLRQKYLVLKPLRKNYKTWIQEDLLPNTRIIIEPFIEGKLFLLKYKYGLLESLITSKEIYKDNTIRSSLNLPRNLPIQKDIYIKGVYTKLNQTNIKNFSSNNSTTHIENSFVFHAFQIINTDLNHYSQLIELKKLGFLIPPSEYTKANLCEIQLIESLLIEDNLFDCNYKIKGIILKVNSRKLQKQMGVKNKHFQWSCAILINK